MSAAPLVSVVVPVYDGARYLGAAIESVLAQAYRPLEVVVVDDGSRDGSAAVARAFGEPVRVCGQPHAGIAVARNTGVAHARGALLAFLDADDLWTADKLARQLAALEADPSLDLVFAHARQFLSPDLDPATARQLRCPPEPVPGRIPGTLLARRAAVDRVGPFDTTRRVGEFIDWYGRAVDLGLRQCLLPETLLLRRLHGRNTGIRARDAQTDYVQILKAALDRRRRAQRGGETP